MRILTAAVCLALTVCLTTVPMCADGPPLADRLPADTLAYAGLSGRTLTFDGSMLGQLVREPGLAEAFASIQEALVAKARQEDARAARGADRFLELTALAWKHPSATALLNVSEQGGRLGISAVVLVDLGKDREQFTRAFDAFLPAVLAKDARPKDVTAGPLTYKAADLAGGETVYYGYRGDVFFAAIGSETPGRLAQVTQAKSLAQSKAFASATMVQGGEDIQAAHYVDVRALVGVLEKVWPRGPGDAAPSFRETLDVLGLGKVTALGGTTRIVDRGLHARYKLFSPAPHRGVLLPLAGGELTDADLKGVPADADVVVACKFSPARAQDELKRVLPLLSKDADEAWAAAVAAAGESLGLSVEKDVLAAIGDTWVLASAPSLGGPFVGTVLSVSLADAERFRRSLDKLVPPPATTRPAGEGPAARGLLALFDLIPHSTRAGRTEIRYAAGPGLTGNPLAPAWCVHENQLLLAGWPQVLTASVERPAGAKRLVDDAAFRKSRAKVSAKPSVLVYVNCPNLARQNYGGALLLWTMLCSRSPRGEVPALREHWLPALSSVEKYIWPSVLAVSSDAEGITYESYSSLPVPLTGVDPLSAPWSIAAAIPAIQIARGRTREADSMLQLEAIGKARAAYEAGTNNAQAPEGFIDLVESDVISAKVLISPVSGRKLRTDAKGLPVGEIDYVYVKLPPAAPGRLVNAYERPENYGGKGTVVLLHDLAVRWMDAKTFQERLQETQEYLKKAHEIGEPSP